MQQVWPLATRAAVFTLDGRGALLRFRTMDSLQSVLSIYQVRLIRAGLQRRLSHQSVPAGYLTEESPRLM